MTYLEKVDAARGLIDESVKRFPRIALGCSFGKDSMVTLHLALSVWPKIPVFAVLANTEFPETYAIAREVVGRYVQNYVGYFFRQDPAGKCCGRPKVEKTKEALASYDAWISGLRKTEGITRTDFEYVEHKGGLVKFNPILEFTELDVWRYLAVNQIPVNPVYARGYRSLGCRYCSSPEVNEYDTERAGRWRGTADACGECGIHTEMLR
jgi:phosphoadenosine phosphosulfate reductase